MEPTVAAVLGVVAGLGVALLAIAAIWLSDRGQDEDDPGTSRRIPDGVADVLAVLRSSGIVLDSDGTVVNNSPPAVAYGLVRRGQLVPEELRDLARRTREDGVIREVELDLPRGPVGRGMVNVRARIAPLGAHHVLVLVEDHTQAKRVEATRRDFVANVSHELKTPVGGISLLAEAVLDAKDDPEAVSRFAARMKIESERLVKLVQEIVDLSRLQANENVGEPELVDIEAVIREAVDHQNVASTAKDIDVRGRVEGDVHVYGDRNLLVTAVGNLVGNAIAYSGEGTRVGVGARRTEDVIEISVTDQGPGIAAEEQERIFERFYRVDSARSRSTGGTGLGLSIVKHICANHGGDVSVWSEEGHGSTFTIRLPAAPDRVEHTEDITAQGDPNR